MRWLFCALPLVVGLTPCGCAQQEPDSDQLAEGGNPTPETILVLREYLGRDLSGLSDDETRSLRTAISRLDGSCPLSNLPLVFGPVPRHVWEFARAGEPPRYLVCETSRYDAHPGATRIRLLLVDGSGTVQAKSEFTTGWRRYLKAASLAPFGGGEYPAVVLECREWGFEATSRDYYALIDTRFDLIRTEGRDGRAARNRYFVHRGRLGPEPPPQAPERWEADLCAPDRARVLRALVWLGGRHSLPSPPGGKVDDQYEDEETAALVRRVRARAGTVARLRELAAKGSEWEREAARLAQHPDDVKR